VIERLSAEELCCGIAGLSQELQILEYERSARKDEIKKCLIKREWQHEFSPEQWKLIEGVLDSPIRLRGMLNRSRMIAECHGSCGLPTTEMMDAIDEAHELGKTVENFREYLECYNIAFPGKDAMFSVVKKAVVMANQKGYLASTMSPSYADEELLSARQTLSLTPSGSEILIRQGRQEPVFTQEVLPDLSNQPSNASTADHVTPGATQVAGMGTTPGGGEGESETTTSVTPQPGHQAGEPTPTPQAVNYMQFPILVNDSSLRLVNDPSNPSQYLVQATSPGIGGWPQYQYVPVAVQNSGQLSNPAGANLASQNQQRANHQVVAPTLSPGTVRLVTAATPNHNSGVNYNGQNQLLLTQALTPTPTRAQQANPYGIVQEGERTPTLSPSHGVVPTPMGLQALASPTITQHEGRGHYVLAYAPPTTGFNLISV